MASCEWCHTQTPRRVKVAVTGGTITTMVCKTCKVCFEAIDQSIRPEFGIFPPPADHIIRRYTP